MTPIRHAVLVALCAILIWASANLAVMVFARGARLDVGADRIATVSPPAQAALDRLAEPMTLTLVFSRDAARDHPALEAHGLRVREYLRQLSARSGGMVRLAEIDPRPQSAALQYVTDAGLRPLAEGPRGSTFLGLVGVNAVDERAIAPPLTIERAALLERDVVALIATLESAHLTPAAAAAVPARPLVDRRLAFARAPGSELERNARLEAAQRILLLVHALLLPLLIVVVGLGVRRWRSRMGGADA